MMLQMGVKFRWRCYVVHSKIVDNNFGEVRFKRNDKVITLASVTSTIKIADKKIETFGTNTFVVVDGGYFLHKIVRQHNDSGGNYHKVRPVCTLWR